MLTSAGAGPRRSWRAGGIAALAVAALAACGDDAGSPTLPTTSPGVQSFANLAPQEARFVEVQASGAATLTAEVDWTSEVNDLDLYLTPAACGALSALDLFAARCTVLARATGTGINDKPQVLQAVVSAGTLRVWVVNFGPGVESGRLAVSLSPR